ncbi:thioredoxin-like fold domain-containing protein MRL7L, chloroplastic [Cinnamomum micranthum f. kanehirae]|uniref:Thioredoxin-like fold domain-containing protein MRL7L, chloroplastic n=1 Tax=Cinnamomum micranthum f. kanehirae TaxID=337451 RepID=A0A443N456_9MAGN|nr:thioredoxin-like fold domain-containing protein MRL7L, chloroplastic [Cinnamomum micranthum f. kanehirae]
MVLQLRIFHPPLLLEKELRLQFSSASASFLPPSFKHKAFTICSSSSSSSSWTRIFCHANPKNQKKHYTQLLASQKATEQVSYDDEDEERRKTRKPNYDNDDEVKTHESFSSRKANAANDPFLMSAEERREWRMKIREVLDSAPDVEEEMDPVEKKKRMEKLLANYPLVVDEDDPDWPEDADGWGFNLNQFFNKITIKNVKKDDDDDENYDSDKEIVWQDDNYIRPIKDITTAEWEETVFKDISPLIILVHNRYKRPRDNEKLQDELDKAVQVFWNSGLPSPRCVAIDAVVEDELASALGVSVFPELIFTKAGKIMYREKVIRTADELSKIMAFFFYGAFRPPCLNGSVGDSQERIPSMS